MSLLFASYVIDLSNVDPVVAAGLIVLALLGVAQAVKVVLDIKRGFAPTPAYEDRFAPKGEVIRLTGRIDKIEGWVEQKLNHHLEDVSSKIDQLRESQEVNAKTVNAELQSIQRALGRLEGTTNKGRAS